MPIRPDRLRDQYAGKAQAELQRGSGWWPAQPEPCPLEPPYEPYQLKELTAWDCAVNGWEAPYEDSWLKRTFDNGPIVLARGAPIRLPSIPFPNSEDLIVISVEQFAEDETALPFADRLLRSLLAARYPITFEIVGMGAKPEFDHQKAAELIRARESLDGAITGWTEPFTSIQFTCRRVDTPLVEQQLAIHYPNSSVVAGAVPVSDLHLPLQWDADRTCGATLALENTHAYPIRTFRQLAPDPISVAISAMENVGREDWALLQVLFEPARQPWEESLRQAMANPYTGGESSLDSDEQRMLKAKLSSPLFAASIRLLASRPEIWQQLVAWTEQFANPPHQRLLVNQMHWENGRPGEFERWWLEVSAEYRTTYRPGLLLNTEELAGLVHLPGESIVSERLRRVRRRTRPVKPAPHEPGSVLLGENVHRGRRQPARIPADIRPWHAYIAGATGTGKSALILNMLLQDIHAGSGVGVLDPHGDLISEILPRIPEERVDDVVYFNPSDTAFPPALNILQAKNRLERERIVQDTVLALHRFFPDSWGPRLQHILMHTLGTVAAIRGGTLREVRRILTDADFRFQVVAKLRDPDLISFWNQEFPDYPKGSIDPILNKLSPFLLPSAVRHIVCQPDCLIDFEALLQRRRILLANLSFGLLGEAVAGTLGTFLMTKLLAATFRRAGLSRDQRPPFYLYVDEFQHFLHLGHGFDKVLSEARKFGLVLAGMANQYVAQLTPAVRAAILGNVGTLVVFRLGLDDARVLAGDLQAFTADEIMSLERGEALARVGTSGNVFNLLTAPPPSSPQDNWSAEILTRSRVLFARQKATVERGLSGAARHRASAEVQQELKEHRAASHPACEATPTDLSPLRDSDLNEFVT